MTPTLQNILYNYHLPRFSLLEPTYALVSEYKKNSSFTTLFWLVVYMPQFIIGCVLRAWDYYCTPQDQDVFLKRALFLKKIEPSEYPKISKIARSWKEYADTYVEKEAVFNEYSILSRMIAECIENPGICGWLYDEAYLCTDADAYPQGIMLIKHDGALFRKPVKYLKISHLVTHPHNVRSLVNEFDFSRVQGVGSFCIQEALKICQKTKQKGVYVEVSKYSKVFYEKMGFQEISKKKVETIIDGDYVMVLIPTFPSL